MGTAEKISVSLPAEDLAWARKLAESQGKTLSAVFTEALSRQRRALAGARLLRELGTGDITQADLDGIRAELGWAPKAVKRKKTRARTARGRKA